MRLLSKKEIKTVVDERRDKLQKEADELFSEHQTKCNKTRLLLVEEDEKIEEKKKEHEKISRELHLKREKVKKEIVLLESQADGMNDRLVEREKTLDKITKELSDEKEKVGELLLRNKETSRPSTLPHTIFNTDFATTKAIVDALVNV